MSKPLSPSSVRVAIPTLPAVVIDVFNELIAREWDGHRAVVLQTDAAELIAQRMGAELHENPQCRRAVAFERGYLDVEATFRAEGWKVEYEKGAYWETWEPFFTFRKGRKRKVT